MEIEKIEKFERIEIDGFFRPDSVHRPVSVKRLNGD
jgi:hypothetical protein